MVNITIHALITGKLNKCELSQLLDFQMSQRSSEKRSNVSLTSLCNLQPFEFELN